MLAPAGIVEINAVCGFVILVLQGGEELVDTVLFRPVAVHPGEHSQNNNGHYGGQYKNSPFPRLRYVVGLSIKKRHNLPPSIIDFPKVKVTGLEVSAPLKRPFEMPIYITSAKNGNRVSRRGVISRRVVIANG